MIQVKNAAEMAGMRRACAISAAALKAGGAAIEAGITTAELDKIIYDFIVRHGARPNFLHLHGFPGTACISVNEEVIHGIPSDRVLHAGDIVKIDVGAFYRGYHGDCAASFPVGEISDEAKDLIEVTRECFFQAVNAAEAPGARLGDIGHAVQSYAEVHGCGVVREYVGHGVGQKLHEDPEVPNYGSAGHGVRLSAGMTIAIEPMINAGTHEVRTLANRWTVVTKDGKLSSHYENTVALTKNGVWILTDPN